ncbi:ABC transporter permease [Candidatus Dependentiae bacterium]|nr:ABC transporter permease [Candidatus Dependentiae bacterium]
MLFKFAFRNVMRNKKRSFLTALSIFFAALIVCFAQGWVFGLFEMLTSGMINYQSGNVRIITEEYKNREKFLPVDEIINNSDEIIMRIERYSEVKYVEERIRFGIMLGKDETTVFGLGIGIDFDNKTFNLKQKVIKGNIQNNGIAIGKDLAQKLGVDVGEELLLATKTSEGGLNGIKLPVTAIITTGMKAFDKKVFFISLENAKKLLKIRNGTTEIYIYTKQHEDSEIVQERIKEFLPEGTIALTYKEQLGGLIEFIEIEKKIIYFIFAIIIFLASFVVINTMIKAVFERLREIGTLKAIGMTDRDMFINFTIEGSIIGAFGGVLGSLAGLLILIYLNNKGVDVSAAAEGSDIPFESIIYPPYNFSFFVVTAIFSIIIPALSSMIPAKLTKKFTPSEMLRKI